VGSWIVSPGLDSCDSLGFTPWKLL